MPELLDWILENEDSFRKSRLPSLYSDLPLQRTTNPDGYTLNISAWQTALSHAALAGKILSSPSLLTLRADETLLSALSSRQYGRPLGLGAVAEEAVREGRWMRREEFLSARGSVYSRRGGWVMSPWEVVRWGVRTILGGLGDVDGRLKGREFVVLENVERVAAETVKKQEQRGQGLTDRIWSREAFVKELAAGVGDVRLPDQDVELLLEFLSRDKPTLSYNDKVVKFKPPTATLPEPITHQDATIASLKQLVSTLTSQCDTLTTRISSLNFTALAAVKASNRISALSALRSKKLAERTLKQRSDTLAQLEEVYAQIEQAADQVEIVRTMKASAVVLRGLNKQVGGLERVEDVIESLRVEMGKVDEVEQVIAEPLGAREQIDEGAVDEELEAMEREEREEREKEEREKEEREKEEREKEEREKEEKRVREREEREAEVMRQRLEEVSGGEDLEKMRRVEKLEQWKKNKLQESIARPQEDAKEQLDASTKRLSQMSIEDDDGARKSYGEDRMQGVQEAVAEHAS